MLLAVVSKVFLYLARLIHEASFLWILFFSYVAFNFSFFPIHENEIEFILLLFKEHNVCRCWRTSDIPSQQLVSDFFDFLDILLFLSVLGPFCINRPPVIFLHLHALFKIENKVDFPVKISAFMFNNINLCPARLLEMHCCWIYHCRYTLLLSIYVVLRTRK